MCWFIQPRSSPSTADKRAFARTRYESNGPEPAAWQLQDCSARRHPLSQIASHAGILIAQKGADVFSLTVLGGHCALDLVGNSWKLSKSPPKRAEANREAGPSRRPLGSPEASALCAARIAWGGKPWALPGDSPHFSARLPPRRVLQGSQGTPRRIL